jgi:hypothetical protein
MWVECGISEVEGTHVHNFNLTLEALRYPMTECNHTSRRSKQNGERTWLRGELSLPTPGFEIRHSDISSPPRK